MEERISNEDIDNALQEWSNLGFVQESLEILKNNLYGKVVYRLSDVGHGGRYTGFDHSKNSHVILFGRKGVKKASTRYHEIRHCATAEIFRIFLDEGSKVYDGLSKEQKNEGVIEVYKTARALADSKATRFMARIHWIVKEDRETIKAIKQIPTDRLSALQTIRRNKGFYADAFGSIFYLKNASLYETICCTAEEVNKRNLSGKITLPLFLVTSVAYTYGLTLLDLTKTTLLNTAYLFGLGIPATLGMGYFVIDRFYGNKKLANKLRSRLSTTREPYQQFLNFINPKINYKSSSIH